MEFLDNEVVTGSTLFGSIFWGHFWALTERVQI